MSVQANSNFFNFTKSKLDLKENCGHFQNSVVPKSSSKVVFKTIVEDFLLQFYSVRTFYPESLHLFYCEDSLLSLTINHNSPPIVGRTAIRNEISTQNYKNCVCNILFYTFQPISDNLIIILISGQLSNNEGPLRRYCETFTLQKIAVNRFSILNHLFHFQDEESCLKIEDMQPSQESKSNFLSQSSICGYDSNLYSKNDLEDPAIIASMLVKPKSSSSILPIAGDVNQKHKDNIDEIENLFRNMSSNSYRDMNKFEFTENSMSNNLQRSNQQSIPPLNSALNLNNPSQIATVKSFFVGNIHPLVDNLELKSAVEKRYGLGVVANVKLMNKSDNNRKYAFVTINKPELLDQIIHDKNPITINGEKVIVDRRRRTQIPTQSSIFCGNHVNNSSNRNSANKQSSRF